MNYWKEEDGGDHRTTRLEGPRANHLLPKTKCITWAHGCISTRGNCRLHHHSTHSLFQDSSQDTRMFFLATKHEFNIHYNPRNAGQFCSKLDIIVKWFTRLLFKSDQYWGGEHESGECGICFQPSTSLFSILEQSCICLQFLNKLMKYGYKLTDPSITHTWQRCKPPKMYWSWSLAGPPLSGVALQYSLSLHLWHVFFTITDLDTRKSYLKIEKKNSFSLSIKHFS